ncbi:MAG: hypothetical protein RL313_515, partial [Actinomycetota bacterium]
YGGCWEASPNPFITYLGSSSYLLIDLSARFDARITTDWHIRGQVVLLPSPDYDLGLLSLDPGHLGSPRGFSELTTLLGP